MEQPILNGLAAYNTEGCYPWHMPGHKQRLNTIFPEPVDNPFLIDVTEIGELDEFHCPEGIIKEAFVRAAEIYGSKHSYYLINGSTCGILAAISAVCRQGDCLIVARNCHKSVYHAIRLLKLKPVYIMPEWNEELKMFAGMTPDTVKCAVKEHPEAKGIILVSPTYEGVVSDIERIAKIAHKAGMPLIVDEAHGAHFEFMANVNETISSTDYRKIPGSAIRLGADIVIESLHKTLPAMTQCAILHENSQLIERQRLEEFLSIYQSSSPSYVFLASMEACIEKMNHERDGLFIIYKELLAEYRKQFGQLKNIHLVQENDFKKQGIFGYDGGKLVFSVGNCGIKRVSDDGTETVIRLNGVMFEEMLEKEYGQMLEMAAGDYVIAMTSVADSKEAFEALYQAMKIMDEQFIHLEDTTDTTLYKELPKQCMDISEARDCGHKEVELTEAAGRISGEYIDMYPPGIPIVIPGEELSTEVLKDITWALEHGLNIKGVVRKEESVYISIVEDS